MKTKMRKPSKKLVIILTVVLLLCAVGCGVWYYLGHRNTEPVYVYPFDYVGMTEYWGDSQESYGPVTTDKIQTIFLTDTQTITEVCVKEGDAVRKGDLLMTFDTTLSDLALERKRLEVEKLKLQLEDAKKRLREINGMKPMVIPSHTAPDDEETDKGFCLGEPYYLSGQTDFDGSSVEKSLVCWIRGDTSVDGSLFEAIREAAEDYQNYNAEFGAPDTDDGEDTGDAEFYEEDYEYVPFEVNSFYVVMKVTEGNMSLGRPVTWQGLHVRRHSGDYYTFTFFDASYVGDHTLAEFGDGDLVDMPEIDFGSGFTAAQIAEMRREQEKTIQDLEFQIKMADADYRIMQTEVSDGNIYATIDGTVISLLDEQEAKMTQQPVMKVSGGGGFYVECSVSELDKDSLEIGQEVEINDWRSGASYQGTIHSLGDFPSSDSYWNGMNNPNATFYPFYVFVDESADLQAGDYVSVMYSAGTSQNGIYLQNPFVRTENGRSYVLVRGEDGKLEQRFVTTGKSLWGSYTEILDGLTAEDLVAFPYGKNVKPGVAAQEGDRSNLYG